ncbi:MAG: bifunctional riboflavin kinase/FAD synthetase [Clostridiales bacterium]|jgi:riboflavin kinase/FMN adenylyltransferase|nr:bifunctional riboflavin kinase/FAD synthetase [Clostridiales bacterium]
MIYINDPEGFRLENSVVCIGNFDGVHRGHIKLIEETVSIANSHNLKSVVFSFYPHPRAVLGQEGIKFIITSKEKAYLLNKFELGYFIEYPFERGFANLAPEQFFARFLIDMLGCKALVVGEGYKFGKDKSGDLNILKKLVKEHNVFLSVQPNLYLGSEKISSSEIRKWILNSEFDKAEEALGSPYFIKSEVVLGKQIGRRLNFPTANLIADGEKLIPGDGIYATKTNINGRLYTSVTNIGKNPTLNSGSRTIETYVFDFDNIIYGKEIIVYFYKKVREEIKFSSIGHLKKQISNDVLEVKKFFFKGI